MMGVLILIGCITAAVRLNGTDLFGFAVIVAIANFWGLGVMHNYRDDPVTPRAPAAIHILSSIAGIVLLLISFGGK